MKRIGVMSSYLLSISTPEWWWLGTIQNIIKRLYVNVRAWGPGPSILLMTFQWGPRTRAGNRWSGALFYSNILFAVIFSLVSAFFWKENPLNFDCIYYYCSRESAENAVIVDQYSCKNKYIVGTGTLRIRASQIRCFCRITVEITDKTFLWTYSTGYLNENPVVLHAFLLANRHSMKSVFQ